MENNLARTPPLGWNSWNQVRCTGLTEAVVKQAADAMVSRGLRDVGFEYIVVDDCWQGGRDDQGALFANPATFPSGMPALIKYVHSLGLKFGIYAVPGSETCANFWDSYCVRGIGSHGYERIDAETFAAWGVDYVKYDWCRADVTDQLQHRSQFELMRDELQRTGRDVVYAISEYGDTKPWEWARPIANLWRSTPDIGPDWLSITRIISGQAELYPYSGPGAWNDPDMLQVGNGLLTIDENVSHIALWSMLAAPLFLGTDLAALPESIMEVLTNPHLIAINQDALGQQARRIVNEPSGWQVWARPLSDGGLAVAFLNASDSAGERVMTINEVVDGLALMGRPDTSQGDAPQSDAPPLGNPQFGTSPPGNARYSVQDVLGALPHGKVALASLSSATEDDASYSCNLSAQLAPHAVRVLRLTPVK